MAALTEAKMGEEVNLDIRISAAFANAVSSSNASTSSPCRGFGNHRVLTRHSQFTEACSKTLALRSTSCGPQSARDDKAHCTKIMFDSLARKARFPSVNKMPFKVALLPMDRIGIWKDHEISCGIC